MLCMFVYKNYPMECSFRGVVCGGPLQQYRACGFWISYEWSYVTTLPSPHDPATPILSPVLFMHVGHPYIPFFRFVCSILFHNNYTKCQCQFTVAVEMAKQ